MDLHSDTVEVILTFPREHYSLKKVEKIKDILIETYLQQIGLTIKLSQKTKKEFFLISFSIGTYYLVLVAPIVYAIVSAINSEKGEHGIHYYALTAN